jgi:hypothetical protein
MAIAAQPIRSEMNARVEFEPLDIAVDRACLQRHLRYRAEDADEGPAWARS